VPSGDHRDQPFEQLIAEFVILLAFLAQGRTVDGNGLGRPYGTRIELPAVRRHKPRPAHRLASAHGLNPHRATIRCVDFEGDTARTNQKKHARRFAFTPKQLVGTKIDESRARGQCSDVSFGETARERMLGHHGM
jgi:hypothetical protein